jgi:hypothetical protein
MTLSGIDKQARDPLTQEGGQYLSNLFFSFGVKHLLHRTLGPTTFLVVNSSPIMSDEIVWQVINQQFCSYKLK